MTRLLPWVSNGLNTGDSITTTGFTTVSNVAATGMDNLNEMQFGMTTVGAIGTHGMDTDFETLGIQGMLGIHETNEDWLNYGDKRYKYLSNPYQISSDNPTVWNGLVHPSLVTMMATECLTALVVVTLKV